MSRHIFLASTLVLLAGFAALGQIGSVGTVEPRTDVPYWVNHWSQPPVIVYGPDEQAFYQSMQVILFPNDNHDEPLDPGALDANVRWLTDHPNVQFYVNGYASSEGDWLYNLGLAKRRADWVKQALISRGIAESRIKVSSGWGELYPVCPENNDECWGKNRIVRFIYSPN